MTNGGATDELAFADIIVARSIGASILTEVVLRHARQRIGNGSMAIIICDAAALKTLRSGSRGLECVVRLIAVMSGERRPCLVVGHPSREWVREAATRLGQPAIFCDASTECVLIRTNGSVETVGPFEPRTLAEGIDKATGAATTFDAVAQGWGQALIEQNLLHEHVTDEQRTALLEKLRRLGQRGHAVVQSRTDS